MTSRKILIVEKYKELYECLSKNMDGSLLPTLDTTDVADLVFFITYFFIGIHTLKEFDVKLEELIHAHGLVVSDDARQIITSKIMDFVVWLRTL